MSEDKTKKIEGKEPTQEQLLKELNEAVESKNADSAEIKGKIEKISAKLDEHETKNQELTVKVLEAQKHETETKEKYDAMERKLLRIGGSDGGYQESKEAIKQFEDSFVKKDGQQGSQKIPQTLLNRDNYFNMKTLRTDILPDGGFLLNPAPLTELQRNFVEISPIRSIARVRSGSTASVKFPLRTTNLTSQNRAQTQSSTESTPTFQLREITAYAITAQSGASVESLMDTAFNMESELFTDMNIEFARNEGSDFVNGDGVQKSQGLLQDASVNIIASANAGAIEWDDLINLEDLKEGYKLTYLFNRSTLIALKKLKDGDGRNLWQPNVGLDVPATINGHPYVIAQDMPSIATNAKAIIAGDFSLGYTIYDRTGVDLIRDPFTLAADRIVLFTAHKFVGGMVTKPEAFNVLQVA